MGRGADDLSHSGLNVGVEPFDATIMTKQTHWFISSDGLFFGGLSYGGCERFEKIDRSIAIVVEAAQNLNRANFPLKSKAKKSDGLIVGLRPSAENFCV
jgi:hypothetical protein